MSIPAKSGEINYNLDPASKARTVFMKTATVESNYSMHLYVLIHLHVLVRVRLCSQKGRQRKVVKQAIRVGVNRVVLSPSAVKDYTVMCL